MRRREFLSVLGSAAAWPLATRAQQPPMPVIGFLSGRAAREAAGVTAAFRDGLSETGFVEGQNVAIEYRWAERQFERLPDLVAELIRRKVAVIVATGGDLSPLAAKAATTTIPIVFVSGRDPIDLGLVTRINRPGGNVTGSTLLALDLEGKRLGLLRELLPAASRIAMLLNPSATLFDAQLKDLGEAARATGLTTEVFRAANEREIDAAFVEAVNLRVDALFIGSDPFLNGRQEQLVVLTQHYRLPAISSSREFTERGGLISYGTSFVEAYRQVGRYAGQVLKGANPGELPVMLPTRFELVINLKAAKALRLQIPPTLLARADEVIE